MERHESAIGVQDLGCTFGALRAVDWLFLGVPAGIVFGFLARAPRESHATGGMPGPPHTVTERSGLTRRIDDWMSGYPDLAARRFLHKAPVALWRLGLGPVAGRSWMLLTTRGRATGLPRRTPLTPHPMGGHLYAWDPYGERSHWYRNLTADPIVTVQTSKGAWTARAVRPADDAEVARLYELLRRFDARMLRRYLESLAIGDSVADVVANKGRLHVVRLDPTSQPGPPALGADLSWAWALPALAALGRRVAALRRGGRRRR